jgi:tetratricopeptide (TPR) repeat protein
MAAHGDPLGAKKRLDSWKEIATFFDRDERTVKRWEKERGLPVYRVPGSARGGVFAYAEELAEWLKAPNVNWENAEPAPSAPSAAEHDDRTGPVNVVAINIPDVEIPAVRVPADVSAQSSAPALRLVPYRSKMAVAKTFLWLVPLILIAGSFFIFTFSHRELRFKKALAAPHTPGTEAQDLYLKGRYYFEKRTADDLNRAVDFFTQAIVHDPGYAAPYVGLADSYNLLREYSAMPSQEAYPRAQAAASKAVELDPNSAEAHNSLAFADFWGFFDAATADREFKRAIELDPNLPRAHHWYATFLSAVRRDREALVEIERARQLEPSSTPILADKGFILASAGKTEEARALLTQIAVSQPDFVPPHRYLAEAIYFPEGNYESYLSEMETVAHLRHDVTAEKEVAAEQKAYSSGGKQRFLEERLRAAREAFDHAGGSAFELATAYADLGQKNDALKCLEIAYRRHDPQLTTLDSAFQLQPLHREREFRALAAKLGLPPVQ